MTKTARRVLHDVEHALAMLGPSSQNERFRIYWFSVVGMLRAVGHVLSKVDTLTSIEMKQAIESQWKSLQMSKPEPAIFWSFIFDERNRFLKEYQTSFKSSLVTRCGNGETIVLIEDVVHGNGSLFASGIEVSSCFRDGPFKGRNPMDVAREAICWWSKYLDEVDRMTKLL